MKKVLGLVLVGLLGGGLLASSALGAQKSYVSLQAGAVFLDDADTEGIDIEFDTGFGILGAVGFDLGQVRLEGEVAYRENEVDRIEFFGRVDGEFRATSLMVNGWVDFENDTVLTPFFGAGLGFANIEGELEGDEEDDNVFAYQLGVGVGIALAETTSLDVSYRFFATSDPEFDGIDSEYDSHNLLVGLRFSF